jgi:ankyrin repeat protein
VEAVNHRNESKLAVAVYDGVGLDLLGLLVDAGANPLGGIEACCYEGNVHALELLVKRGTDVSSVSLCSAATNGHSECLRILIEAKASVDGVSGETYSPVYMAADCGQVECVRTLVEMKANVHRSDPWGWSPLMTVTRRNNSEDRREKNRLIAELLRAHGA